jgi:hypothetical protein
MDAAPPAAPVAPVTPPAAKANAPAAKAPDAPAGEPPKVEPKPEPRRYKVKIDDEEVEVDEQELQRGYSHSRAANKRMQEAAKARKEADELIARAKADPWETLKGAGLDPDALAMERVYKLMEAEKMTPEQRAIAERDAKIKEFETREATAKEQAAKAQADVEMAAAREQLNREIPEAAKAHGLPPTPRVGRMMLENMMTQARTGRAPDAGMAARYALETVRAETSALLRDLPPEQVVKVLGADLVAKLNAYAVQQVRGGPPPAPVPPASSPSEGRARQAVLSPAEWREKYG